MNRKLLKTVLMAMMCTWLLMIFNSNTAYAAMKDEAESYEMGEWYKGHGEGYAERYFKFVITEKSHVTFYIQTNADEYDFEYCGIVYNSSGKQVLKTIDLIKKFNKTTGYTSAQQYRVLSPGTYYLQIGSLDLYNGYDFKFKIQAEKQIKLAKGSFKSLSSAKKGQMTVKCNTAKYAIGYRIQYSTDYRFKKGVKTIYSPTANKTITGLKAGQRYYVKVCPYTVYDDGTRVTGQNSYVKAVVVRKK